MLTEQAITILIIVDGTSDAVQRLTFLITDNVQ